MEIIYRSFELDPRIERNVPYDIYDKLSMKYGMSREEAKATCDNIKRQAEMVGLDYQFDSMVLTNTFDAHRLTLFAGQHGKMRRMSERLFRAFFTESRHIGDRDTLIELAVEVGLDREQVARMLDGDDFTAEVRADEQEAMNIGVRGVPFYVIDKRWTISGAQPSEVFLSALEQAWQEQEQTSLILDDEGGLCDDSGCRVDGKKE